MSIKFLDMFAGIGGFRSGLEAIGGFECVGYCEIDKYAKQAVFYLLPERENDRISHRPLTQSVKPVGRNESEMNLMKWTLVSISST